MKICLFGLFAGKFYRNDLLRKGLERAGATLYTCTTQRTSILRYVDLWRAYKKIPEHDVVYVPWPGYRSIFLARLLSRKPIVYDLAYGEHEMQIISRKKNRSIGIYSWFLRTLDRLGARAATLTSVETASQRDYISTFSNIPKERMRVIYSGCHQERFPFSPPRTAEDIRKTRLHVLLRGQAMTESGLRIVAETMNRLKDKPYFFHIISGGDQTLFEREFKQALIVQDPAYCKVEFGRFEQSYLQQAYVESDVTIGHLANHERTLRTIPYKAFESMSTGRPYITAASKAVSELLQDGVSCVFIEPGSVDSLAAKLEAFRLHPEELLRIGEAAHKQAEQVSIEANGRAFLALCQEAIDMY